MSFTVTPAAVERPFLKGILALLMPTLLELVKKLLESGVPVGAAGAPAPADLKQRLQKVIDDHCDGK